MKDKWIRIIGYPIVIGISAYVFHHDAVQAGGWELMKGVGMATLFTVLIWEGNRLVFKKMAELLPRIDQTVWRVIGEIGLSVVYSTLVQVVVIAVLFMWLGLPSDKGMNAIDWYECVLFSLVPLPVMGLVYEASYFFQEWKKNIQRSESLARSHVQAQLDALKKQLDPHFLFNSLNTLAYLIDLENEPAQEYLSRLSTVYRYVLENRDRATVTLADELAFVEDYLYLNQVRYRENLQIERRLSDESQKGKIPALSLQLLVENAIKHNVISPERPLKISIVGDHSGVTVSNTKQPRASLAQSTKVGLRNLREQYRLLTKQSVEVKDIGDLFQVHLPFLEVQAT